MLSKMARVPQRNDEGALYRLLNNKFCIILSCGLLQNVLSCWLFYFVLRPNPNDPGVVYFVFGSLFKSSPVKHSYLSSCLDVTSHGVMIRELCILSLVAYSKALLSNIRICRVVQFKNTLNARWNVLNTQYLLSLMCCRQTTGISYFSNN